MLTLFWGLVVMNIMGVKQLFFEVVCDFYAFYKSRYRILTVYGIGAFYL